MEILTQLATTLLTTVRDVLPIALVVFGFQFLVIRRPIPNPRRTLLGFAYVLVGLALFVEGLEHALFPIGRLMAEQLTDPAFLFGAGQDPAVTANWQDYYWIYLFAAAIGFAATIAEPALLAVAIKAQEVSGGTISVWGLRIAVAIGVAVGLALGAYRIVTGTPLHYYIMVGYIVVMAQTAFSPRQIISLAYDSGGVTTSTVTVPIVAALGLGLAGAVPGRSPLLDGFGLIAFASLFPIVSVLAYAQIINWVARRRSQTKE